VTFRSRVVRGAMGPRPLGPRHGGAAHDAAPLRKHGQQIAAVRAGLHRGQALDEQGLLTVHDLLQPGYRLQQRRVGVRQADGGHRQRTLGWLHPPLPCAAPQNCQKGISAVVFSVPEHASTCFIGLRCVVQLATTIRHLSPAI